MSKKIEIDVDRVEEILQIDPKGPKAHALRRIRFNAHRDIYENLTPQTDDYFWINPRPEVMTLEGYAINIHNALETFSLIAWLTQSIHAGLGLAAKPNAYTWAEHRRRPEEEVKMPVFTSETLQYALGGVSDGTIRAMLRTFIEDKAIVRGTMTTNHIGYFLMPGVISEHLPDYIRYDANMSVRENPSYRRARISRLIEAARDPFPALRYS